MSTFGIFVPIGSWDLMDVPDAPVLAMAGGAQSVTISWPKVTAESFGSVAYTVRVSTTSNFAAYTDYANQVSPMTVTGLANGTTYYAKAKATNSVGTSAYSSTANVATLSAPSAPTGLTANAGIRQVGLTWSPVAGQVSYNLYWGLSPGVTTASTKISTVALPYTHTGLSNGTTYYYIVTATDVIGEGAASAEANGTTTALPAVPGNLVATTDSATQITATWDAVSGATSYNLYWSLTTGVTINNGTKIAGVTSPYAHTGRTAETTYYYIVTAVNAAGEGAAATEANALTLPAPSTQKTLLHFDGINGTTTTTDIYGNAVTFAGSAVISTTSPKFGTASLLYTTHDYITDVVDVAGPLVFGTAWTIECWINSAEETQGKDYTICSTWPSVGSPCGISLGVYAASGVVGLVNQLSSTGATYNINASGGFTRSSGLTITQGTWYHVALTRDSATGHYYTYFDGTLVIDIASALEVVSNVNMKIGQKEQDNWGFIGKIDEVRLSNTCRYPSGTTFTPPTNPFTT